MQEVHRLRENKEEEKMKDEDIWLSELMAFREKRALLCGGGGKKA